MNELSLNNRLSIKGITKEDHPTCLANPVAELNENIFAKIFSMPIIQYPTETTGFWISSSCQDADKIGLLGYEQLGFRYNMEEKRMEILD